MDPFDLELREARRIIRERHAGPNDFKFKRMPKRRSIGHLRIRQYTVTVSRGEIPPVTYEGGSGKNWVVVFAHDLAMHRFSESAGEV